MRPLVFNGAPVCPIVYRPINPELLLWLDNFPTEPSDLTRRLHGTCDISHAAELMQELERFFARPEMNAESFCVLANVSGELITNASQHGHYRQPLEIKAGCWPRQADWHCLISVRNFVPPDFDFKHIDPERLPQLEVNLGTRGRGLATARDRSTGFIARPYPDRSLEFVLSYSLVRQTQP